MPAISREHDALSQLPSGKAWAVTDRYGNQVYLTWERWAHILEFHPEMGPFLDEIRRAVQMA